MVSKRGKETGEVREEVQEEESESQAIEGYACTCGLRTIDVDEFRGHMGKFRKRPAEHHSLGRVNFDTGEVTMPPAKERSKEQWQEAKYGKRDETRVAESPKEDIRGSKKVVTKKGPIPTEVLGQAMEIKFVPRVYTIDYSPILRIAQDAAVKYWGWRPEMPLGNFIDTVIYLFFKEKGIILAGYIVEETEEEKLERETAIETYQKEKKEVAA